MSSTNANGALPRGWWTDNILIEVVRERIAERVEQGLSDQQIAREVGVSSKTVQRFRAQRGLPANAVNQHGPRTDVPRKGTAGRKAWAARRRTTEPSNSQEDNHGR